MLKSCLIFITLCKIFILDEFHLCSPFDGTLSKDQAVFMMNIIGIIEVAVQYDWNGAINIEDICSFMENESLGTPLERLIKLNE